MRDARHRPTPTIIATALRTLHTSVGRARQSLIFMSLLSPAEWMWNEPSVLLSESIHMIEPDVPQSRPYIYIHF